MGSTQKEHEPIKEDFDSVLTAIADENMPEKGFIAKPFVKWVGGKRSIIQELLTRAPKKYNAYHGPFLGGGAFFLCSQP